MAIWYNDLRYIIPIGVAAGVVLICIIIVLACVCICVCCGCCKRRPREWRVQDEVDHHSVETAPLLANRRDLSRGCTSLQLLEAKMHLRDTRVSYTIVKPVFFIGRAHKEYYLLSHTSGGRTQFLLTVLNEYRSDLMHEKTLCCAITSERERVAAEKFLRLFQSQLPNRVAPILHASFSMVSTRMFVIREVFSKGSLFDFVVGCSPLVPPTNKAVAGHALQESVIRIFGRQILESVWAMEEIGMRAPQLSAHNVLIQKDTQSGRRETPFVAMLSDLENPFMGVPPQPAEAMLFYSPGIRRFKIKKEVLAFGRLLYFMAKGVELANPENTDFSEIISDQLRIILLSIFPKKLTRKMRLPTIQSLLDDPYFSSTLDCPLQSVVLDSGSQPDLKGVLDRIDRMYEQEADPHVAATGVYRE